MVQVRLGRNDSEEAARASVAQTNMNTRPSRTANGKPTYLWYSGGTTNAALNTYGNVLATYSARRPGRRHQGREVSC